MGRKAPTGQCHLCAETKKLSYEHVPPRSAFNDCPQVYEKIDDLIFRPEEPARKEKQQRGAGAYTLCAQCNNDTGAFYGKWYSDFIHHGMHLLHQSNGAPTLHYPFHIFPLRILKQIVCMFFSANPPGFGEKNRELAHFVLKKEQRFIPQGFRFFMFFAVGNRARQSAICGRLDISDRSRNSTFSEITWPPFGFVMTLDNPPEASMHEITGWGDFRYNDFRSWHLKIPVFPVFSFLPGDYRDKDEIDKIMASASNTEGAESGPRD